VLCHAGLSCGERARAARPLPHRAASAPRPRESPLHPHAHLLHPPKRCAQRSCSELCLEGMQLEHRGDLLNKAAMSELDACAAHPSSCRRARCCPACVPPTKNLHTLYTYRPSFFSTISTQYTFILLASKALPKQCVDYLSGKVKTRRSVGVRMPHDIACQAGFVFQFCQSE